MPNISDLEEFEERAHLARAAEELAPGGRGASVEHAVVAVLR